MRQEVSCSEGRHHGFYLKKKKKCIVGHKCFIRIESSRQDGPWPAEAFLKWKQEAIKCNAEHVSQSIPEMPGRGNQGN